MLNAELEKKPEPESVVNRYMEDETAREKMKKFYRATPKNSARVCTHC
jgi:hypothetical protein